MVLILKKKKSTEFEINCPSTEVIGSFGSLGNWVIGLLGQLVIGSFIHWVIRSLCHWVIGSLGHWVIGYWVIESLSSCFYPILKCS